MRTAKQVTTAHSAPTVQKSRRVIVRPVYVLGLALLMIAAVWFFLLVTASTHKTLDQRVYDVASQLKCPVCQGESVANSPSTLSQEMRVIIRQQLQSGRSEQQVIQYFVNSYGQQIVWSPPWQGFSLLAWLVPIGLLMGGVVLLFLLFRDWHSSSCQDRKKEEGMTVESESEEDAKWRAQLEQELAADDPLFRLYTKETR